MSEPHVRVGQAVQLIGGHFSGWRRLSRAEKQVHVVGVVQHLTDEDPTWWVYPTCTRLECSYAEKDFEVVEPSGTKSSVLCRECFQPTTGDRG